MRLGRFTEAQIIGMIKEQEAGMPTAEVCRRHGLSPASFYKFKARYGGMNVSDTHRLSDKEAVNGRVDHERRCQWLYGQTSVGRWILYLTRSAHHASSACWR